MNFALPSMLQIAQLCMNERLEDMDFCRGDDDVNAAIFNCLAAGGGGGGPV